MSNALAIAAVSAVLKDLLNNGLIDHNVSTAVGSPVVVTVLPPDRIKTGEEEQPQLNLFLYQVSANPGWQNSGLPSRDSQGERLTNPPLALDLRYLLTAYGKNDFDGEILLGYAMQLLHETPVLPRDAIRTALGPGTGGTPVTGSILPVGPFAAADLADQVEQIKIAPQNLNTEELSKLWTAMQAHYRPTAAYHLSVVLIENRRPVKAAKPVVKRNLFAAPFRRPTIETVSPQIVLPGSPLTLIGRNFKSEITKLTFGDSLVNPLALSDTSVQVIPPASLLPGVNTVQIVQPSDFGTGSPAEPHRGVESNVTAFILTPVITNLQPITVAAGHTLTLKISPSVGRAQRASLLLGERSFSIPPRSQTGPATTTSLDFAIPADLPTGSYPLRVQVDGAQSALDIDTNKASPTYNQYTGGPTVMVT